MAKKDGAEKTPVEAVEEVKDRIILKGAVRRELPKMRSSKTFSFKVADSHGYITVGEYDDGAPGELFIHFAKHGSTLRGIMDAFAMSVSHGLQYGVPLKTYVKSLSSTSFAPSGITDDPEIRTASSLIDYIFRRLALTYLSFDDRLELGLASIDDMPDDQTSLLDEQIDEHLESADDTAVSLPEVQLQVSANMLKPRAEKSIASMQDDTAPMCYSCGNQTQRSGSCYVCTSCGSTTGCS
jgi:ribonucleoside-diphosphate reductase alpha chain